MNHPHDREADCVARARNLLAAAAQGVDQLENAASVAFCRLTALAGILTRLETLAVSHDPETVEAAALYAATVCREAETLLRSINSREWASIRFTASKSRRGWPRAKLGSTSR